MGIKVFFNDSCNICRFEINHYKKNSDNSLEWVDITNNEDALLLTSKSQKELLRRLHVIDNDKIYAGAKAFIVLWSNMPKYQLLSKLLSLPVIFQVFHIAYEFIAFLLYIKNLRNIK